MKRLKDRLAFLWANVEYFMDIHFNALTNLTMLILLATYTAFCIVGLVVIIKLASAT